MSATASRHQISVTPVLHRAPIVVSAVRYIAGHPAAIGGRHDLAPLASRRGQRGHELSRDAGWPTRSLQAETTMLLDLRSCRPTVPCCL
jgi:hypothetical protein